MERNRVRRRSSEIRETPTIRYSRYNKSEIEMRQEELRDEETERFRKKQEAYLHQEMKKVEWRKSPKGRKILATSRAKRRKLGFIPLNEHFENSEAHHVNKEFVIYIPKELHHSVWHNIWTGQGMEKINCLAFEYLYEIKLKLKEQKNRTR